MPRLSKCIVVVYALFNLLIARTLMFDPGPLDAQYHGGVMTPTREFQWFSIASFHVFMAAVVLLTLRIGRAADRRAILLANAGFYGWDAATQWLYWGDRVELASADLHVNAGVSAGCAALLLLAAGRDREG